MDIRVILPPPWPLVASLVAESLEEGFLFLARFQQEYESGRGRFDADGETFLGVFADSTLAGVAGLTHDHSGDGDEGRVRHLYVRREWRRRGVGRLLVSEIEERARGHFSELVLRTNSAPAARFYRAIGYSDVTGQATATHRRVLALRDLTTARSGRERSSGSQIGAADGRSTSSQDARGAL